MWRKIKFSDFDVESLIKYSQFIEEENRFQYYKRIADVCLFKLGIFPDYATFQHEQTSPRVRRGISSAESKEAMIHHGKHFYRAAAHHRTADMFDLHDVLLNLSDGFSLAMKPLAFMSNRYLAFIKKKIFFH